MSPVSAKNIRRALIALLPMLVLIAHHVIYRRTDRLENCKTEGA